MNNEEKAKSLWYHFCTEESCEGHVDCKLCPKAQVHHQLMEMAKWKDEQLGWHDAKKEQPPMDEEVIVLTNILNGKELSTPRRICFGHIVDKNICVDYDGWNIPGVAYWMYYKEPK